MLYTSNRFGDQWIVIYRLVQSKAGYIFSLSVLHKTLFLPPKIVKKEDFC